MSISDLVYPHLQEKISGNKQGTCIFCARDTNSGISIRKGLSNCFTTWSDLVGGSCICEKCASMINFTQLRRKSWLASQKELLIFTNDHAMDILLHPPDPPFFIHIAKKGQKYTWLKLMNFVAVQQETFWFSYERFDVPVLFERKKAKQMTDLIAQAIRYKISKTELLHGFKLVTWAQAIKNDYEFLLRQIDGYRKNPLWEVMVDVYRA